MTNMYPPHHLGGYELACRDAVTRWRADRHEVVVLTSDTTFAHASSSADGADVRRALRIYWRDGLVVAPSIPERLRIERANLNVLRQTLDDVRPDVVSVWHMGAVSLGLLTEVRHRNVPMVFVIADQWLVYGPAVDGWTRMFRKRAWARGIARLLGTNPTVDIEDDVAVCFASEWLRRDARDHSPLRLPDRLPLVPWGVDRTLFVPGPERDFGWRLLCAGRVEERKGVHVAVEAMGMLPTHATLDIIGSWDDESYVDGLRRRAAELGINDRIRWHGLLSRSELADAYRAADVFLFPVVWAEPFGMVPIEAMASGTPVIATGTGGSDEFLLDGINCLRSPPGDPRALAAKIRAVADDPALRARLVRAGAATSEYYGDDVFGRELDAWHVAATRRFLTPPPPARAPLADTIAVASPPNQP